MQKLTNNGQRRGMYLLSGNSIGVDKNEEVYEVNRPRQCCCCITDNPDFHAVWFQYKQTGSKYSGGIGKKSLQKSCLPYRIPLLKKSNEKFNKNLSVQLLQSSDRTLFSVN